MASLRDARDAAKLVKRLSDPDSGVRYWAALGLQMLGEESVRSARTELRKLLNDASGGPKITAAETLGRFGGDEDVREALGVLREMAPADKNGAAASILAMNAITTLGKKAQPLLETIRTMNARDPRSPDRLQEYPVRLVKTLTQDLS
jgi:hypothetical protein